MSKSKSDSSIKELSLEEKISTFLSDKTGATSINTFLKTVYPVNSNGAANVGNSRYIKGVLSKMQAEGKLKVVNDSHKNLGSTYYPDGAQSAQYNLDTWSVVVEL